MSPRVFVHDLGAQPVWQPVEQTGDRFSADAWIAGAVDDHVFRAQPVDRLGQLVRRGVVEWLDGYANPVSKRRRGGGADPGDVPPQSLPVLVESPEQPGQ